MSVIYYGTEILIIITVLLGKYFWNRRNLYSFAEKFPGPKSVPILGDGLVFWCKDEDIFERAIECIASYPSPMRFWFGPKLAIIFRDARQVEKIFSSMAFANKDDVYKFIKEFNGDGLITGSGPKWKKDRRLMSPLFLKREILSYFPVILRHTKKLVKILEEKIDQPTFDIEHYIHRAATDFVNETVVGHTSNAQSGELDNFLANIGRAYELVHRRIIKPWLQVEVLYKFTKNYKEQVEAKNIIHGFFWKVLNRAKQNHCHLGQKDDTMRSVLDHMLDIRDEVPDFATDEEIIHHLSTLYSASEDTVTVICAFTLVLLGMYPTYQKQVADEIASVVGKEDDIEEKHLQSLECLEMVIKETLRLFPIAPFIMRETSQDTEVECECERIQSQMERLVLPCIIPNLFEMFATSVLDKIQDDSAYNLTQNYPYKTEKGYTIPKGISVIVSIHNIHRDENQWEKPNDFYPEHFLPQAVKKRHPYAYLPFSAGVRGCVGKPYSFMAMKILLVSILQKYVIEADGTLHDKALTTDISVRFKDKNYPIRIKRRE